MSGQRGGNIYCDWERFTAPARPSAGVVRLYQKALEGDRKKVLLLGSTPEIRSVCHEFGHDLHVIDICPEIYENVSNLVECPGPENYICGDWFKMDFGETFSVAIGDGSVNMLEHHLHRPFFQSIYNQLKPGGEIVLHTHFVSKREFERPEEVFQWWRDKKGDRLFEETWYHLTHFYNVGDGQQFTFDYGMFYNDLSRLHREEAITQREYDEYCSALSDHSIRIYFCDWESLRADLAGLFRIEASDCADDYPGAEVHPVLRLRKETTA